MILTGKTPVGDDLPRAIHQLMDPLMNTLLVGNGPFLLALT